MWKFYYRHSHFCLYHQNFSLSLSLSLVCVCVMTVLLSSCLAIVVMLCPVAGVMSIADVSLVCSRCTCCTLPVWFVSLSLSLLYGTLFDRSSRSR